MKNGFVLYATMLVLLALAACKLWADEKVASVERELDKIFVDHLVEKSNLIVAGEPVDYLYQDRYGMVLHADMYFEVKVNEVILGDKNLNGKIIKVGVQRGNVKFRFEKAKPFLFFMKPHPKKDAGGPSRYLLPDWRVVSDYFGVQPYSLTLERMVRSSVENKD